MRIRRILIGAALLLATVNVATVDTAEATTIAPLTTEQMTDASTYIVEGTIDSVWVEEDEDGRVWTRAKLLVDTVYKGPDAPSELIIDALGGHSWTKVLAVESQARFSKGEKVLVFLDVIRHGTRITPVAQFHGKFTIRRAPGETRHHVMRWSDRPNAEFDARFLPHPTPERRVYLDDMRQTITNRLETGWDGQSIPGMSAERLRTVNLPERRDIREVTR